MCCLTSLELDQYVATGTVRIMIAPQQPPTNFTREELTVEVLVNVSHRLLVLKRITPSTGPSTGFSPVYCPFDPIHWPVNRSAILPRETEREILIDNLLVRVHLIIEMSRPALRHGSLNSLFQVALYLPS